MLLLIYSGIIILIYLLLARFVLLRVRWSDKKAKRIFRNRNVPLESYDETIGERHIHYVVSGPDALPTLVFIDGTPASWFRFEKLMLDNELRNKFRVVSIDRPGFGYSDFGKALSLHEQCVLLLPVLRKIKNSCPLFLCGHSYGGAVVAQLAVDAPNLLTGWSFWPVLLTRAQEKKEKWRPVNEFISWFMPGAYRPFVKELSSFKKDLQELAANMDKIKAPVLFIHGDKDKNVPVTNVDYGKRIMKNAASVDNIIMKTASHQLPLTHSREIKEILLQLE